MADNVLLDIQGLQAGYQVYEGYLSVIKGLNLTVLPGERVGLVGESGCGKTTTMKCVVRILPSPPGTVQGGRIEFHRRDLLTMPIREIRKIRGRGMTMVFQDPTAALNPVFTIGEQIKDIIRHGSRRALNAKEIEQKALKAMEEVRLPDPGRILKSYPIQLSGGMRQRVCIAMALSTEPELLIADEPTTSLDVTIQDQILRLLHDLVVRLNTSIIFITHSLGVVREMADRVYVMYAGTIVEEARTDDLFSNPSHPYTIGLFSAVPKLTGEGIAEGIPGRIPDYLEDKPSCRYHERCPIVEARCLKDQPPMVSVGKDHRIACFAYL